MCLCSLFNIILPRVAWPWPCKEVPFCLWLSTATRLKQKIKPLAAHCILCSRKKRTNIFTCCFFTGADFFHLNFSLSALFEERETVLLTCYLLRNLWRVKISALICAATCTYLGAPAANSVHDLARSFHSRICQTCTIWLYILRGCTLNTHTVTICSPLAERSLRVISAFWLCDCVSESSGWNAAQLDACF